jgi:hypothetical protein
LEGYGRRSQGIRVGPVCHEQTGPYLLSAAPKGHTCSARSLDEVEDRLLRSAFGRFVGTAAARTAAGDVVRRYQIAAGGHWFLCDCRPGQDKPPALIPVLESYIRRHVQAGWPQHADACDFFREPAEQVDISASWVSLPKPRVRLVRPFAQSVTDPLPPQEPVSSAHRRPQLARLLAKLMVDSGLQTIGPGERRPAPLPEQVGQIWPVARAISVDRGVRLSDVLCVSLARLPVLIDAITTAPTERFARTRPHGLFLVRLADVRGQELITLSGHVLPVLGRVAVFGEAPEDELDPPGVRAPSLALCLLARPSPLEPVQVCSAYVHPCASSDRVMLVDSDLERRTLARLLSFQSRMWSEHAAITKIEKPLDDLGPRCGGSRPTRPPLIPDFVVSVRDRFGDERRLVVETMSYADSSYRERKERLHPLMRDALGAETVIAHDFHMPEHWRQEWRDNKLSRDLWKQLVTEGQDTRSAGIGG